MGRESRGIFFMGSCRRDIQQGRESGGSTILMTLSLNKIIRLRIKSVDIFVNFAILMLITDGGRCIHGSVPSTTQIFIDMMRRLKLICMLVFTSICMYAADNQPVNLVFIGNSITYGAELSNPTTQAPPVKTAAYVKNQTGREVYYRNCGKSGSATPNWLPGTTLFGNADQAATSLQQSHPGVLIFSIMLGTNDTHEGYKTAPEVYYQNLRTMIEALMSRHPEALFIINYPIWYSPNTHNGAVYLEAGLKRLQTYMPMITQLGEFYQQSARPVVWTGDPTAYSTFENKTEYFVAENGNSGVFYLHPNTTGGTILAEMWGKSIIECMNRVDGTRSDALLLDSARQVVAACMKIKKSSVCSANGMLKAGQITTDGVPAEGSGVEYLTDLNPATYFETDLSSEQMHTTPYLQVDLQEENVKQVVCSMTKRLDSASGNRESWLPNDVVIYASDNPEGTEWRRVSGLHGFAPTGDGGTYVSPLLLTGGSRYLRICVEGTSDITLGAGGALMYNMSELQIYAVEMDEENSPYHQQEDIRKACDELTTICDNAAQSLAESQALTEQQKTALCQGIADLKALYTGEEEEEKPNPDVEYISGQDGTTLYSINKTKRLLTKSNQITANSYEKNAGTFFGPSNLLSTSTDYNTIIWHTAWIAASNPLPAGVDNYLQAHLNEPHRLICFSMIGSNWNATYDTPDHMIVLATNTPEDEDSWQEITELPDMIPTELHQVYPAHYTSPCIDMGGEYTDIRFVVKETVNHRLNSKGNIYVSLARFQIYEPEPVEDKVKQLSHYVGILTAEGAGIKVGTMPGTYPQESVDTFFSILADAELLCQMKPSAEEAAAMYERLSKAYEALKQAQHMLTDGCYIIRSGYGNFPAQAGNKVLKDEWGEALEWNTEEDGHPCQTFRLTRQDNGWTIQNMGTGQYMGLPDGQTKRITCTQEPTTTFDILTAADALFTLKPTGTSANLCIEKPTGGASPSGYIAAMAPPEEGTDVWMFVPIEESLTQPISDKAASMKALHEAQLLREDALGCGKTILLTDASQLYANSVMTGFPVSNLLSKSTSYNTIIYHSVWGNGALPADEYNYLQIHLNEPQADVTFSMIGSSWNNTYDTPDDYVIMATDTPADEDSWTVVTRLTDMIPSALHKTYPARYTSPVIHMDKSYSDMRFVVMSTVNNRSNGNGNIYFSLARFQMYGNELLQDSKYGTIEGLAEAVDQMDVLSKELKNKLGDTDKTAELQEQIERVKAIMNGKPDHITSVPSQKQDNAVYTLQGLRISTPTKGIYITQGKKLIRR